MASNRDPRKSYRRRSRTTVTSSSNRSARSKKSTVPKPTSSSTRSSTKGSSSRVTTGQGGARAKVKTKPTSTGLIGTRNTPATKTTYTGPKTPGVSFNPSKRVQRFSDKPQVKANVKALQSSPLGKLLKGGKVAGALAIAQTVKGALDSRKPKAQNKPDPKPKKSASFGKNYKSQEKQLSRKANAANFDAAFAKARKAGKKVFTWRGKQYTTKLKK